MEERNILWGELVGGLLIVGCSIALVVTLWHRLEAIPYFPFLLSASVTLALYGAGQYTLHHWKLESTSRGLLVIALLLAPLNLLLLSDPIMRSAVALPLDVGVKLGAALLFAWVVRGGGRDVLTARPEWRWPLALAVVGAPASQLLPAAWFVDSLPHLPAWLALGCFVGAVMYALRGTVRSEESLFDRSAGAALLQFVGLAAFGLAAAWGLHIARAPDTAERVRGLALPLVLAAIPVIEAGLLVHRRVLGGALRVTGTGVALAGLAAITGGLVVAWPDPLSILLVSLAAALFLTRIAIRESVTWVNAGAIPAFALSVVVGFHGMAGRWVEPIGSWLGSADTGIVLSALALVFAGVAELLVRRESRSLGASYALGAFGIGLAGLLIASVNGPEYPLRAAVAHAVCAMGLLASNQRWRLRVAAHGGLWLVLVASLWSMYAAYPGDFARWGFAVSLEALAFAGLALLLKLYRGGATALLRRAGRDVSIAAAILVPALAVYAAQIPDSPWHTGALFTLALTGIALARLTGAPLATYLGSTSAFLGVIHLAAFTFEGEPAGRPYLIGILALASVATLAAALLRRQERVFAFPLRRAAQVVSGVAAFVLVVPPAAHAMEWAGYAAWVGLVWLTLALLWRERGAFSVFQLAISLAAMLLGVAWVEAQEWRPAKSLGFFEPAALQTYAVALGLLGLVWVGSRSLLRHNTTARELWVGQTWSAERVVLAVVVVAQFLLVAFAIVPEVKAELTPSDWKSVRAAPEAFAQSFGPGAWLLLGVLAVVVVASWRLTGDERDTGPHLAGLALSFLTAPVLWAGSHASDIASGTALRWGLGFAFAIGTAVIALRNPLRAGLASAGFPVRTSTITRSWLLALLATAAGVVVLISAQVAELGLTGRKPSGPVAGTPFSAMGAVVSNLVPLVLVVLGLAGTAARERSAGYAFAGGLVFIATLAAGYALGVVTAGGRLDGVVQIRVVLLACDGAAVWALAWLAAERRVPGGLPLAIQSRLGLFGLAGIALIGVMLLVARPDWPNESHARALGEFGKLGWFALALATGAAVWQSQRTEPRLKFHALALAATIAGVLIACAAQPWDGEGRWLSFHVLSLAWCAVGVGVGLVVAARKRGEVSHWLDGFAAALTILAIRGAWADPWRPWMPAGLAAVASLVVGAAAIFNRSSVCVVISGLLINLAAVLLWLPSEAQTPSGLLLANAAGMAVAAAVWTAIALRTSNVGWHDLTDFERGIALVLLAFGLAPTLAGDRVDSHWLTWGATLAVVVSMTVALWQREARITRGGLFAGGVAAVLLGASATTTRPVWDVWQTPVALAAFALLTSGLTVCVSRASRPILRIPERGNSWAWLVIAQGVIAAVVVVLGVRTGLTSPELAARLASPVSVLLLTLACSLLLRAVPAWASMLRFAVIGLAVLVLASVWSHPDPTGVAPWLQRNAWLFVSLAAVGMLGTDLTRKLAENWQPAVRTVSGIAAALAVVVLVVNLLQQVPIYDKETRHTPLEPAAVFAMLLGIVGLIVLAIRFAVRQNLDPLQMRDSRRTVYVYLAEILLVLFFTHIRFNVPELFHGAAVRYWTFAVMALAFVGIGLAEFFERRKTDVLAVPLRRTGVLLPLIPLLAFWAKPPAALTEFASGQAPGLSPFLAYLEKLPQHFDTYAWLWFLAGGVYGLVALSRKSFGWALLAALATNAALWSLLTHHEVPFFVHPQAWVIPLALIVLASEHINRRRMREDVSNGLRYLGVGMIYVASAADMFIAGVGQSVWLPVILAIFCVAGVLLGIMMRVRAFLFLGVGFLFLDIFAMIWHAAVNLEQTWVWYASGIVLGVAILALFAVFERRKNKSAEG